MENTISLLFFIALLLLFFTYFGYGAVIWIAVKIKEWRNPPGMLQLPEILPEVTLFISAYNEECMVDHKMENCLSLDYPREKLKIYWVTDGSTDKTNEKLAKYPEVITLFQPERRGKTAAINRGMRYVTTPFVVFTDANAMINRQAIKDLIKYFGDPKTGCVAGEKRILTDVKDVAASVGEGFYWRYESTLKELDARLCSAVGAAGELFAIRTGLYEDMRLDTLLDDFVLSLRIVRQGYRIAYCKNAYAMEKASLNMEEEKKRKIRIAAGGLQAVSRFTELMNIFRYGCFSYLYIHHRVMRWTVAPVVLLLLIPLNIALLCMDASPRWFIQLFALLQALSYVAAVIGWYLDKKRIKMNFFYIPYYFLFMNLNIFSGIIYLFRFEGDAVWEKAKRSK